MFRGTLPLTQWDATVIPDILGEEVVGGLTNDTGDEKTGDTGDEKTGDTGDEKTGDTGDEKTGDTGDEKTGDTGDEGGGPTDYSTDRTASHTTLTSPRFWDRYSV